MPRSKRKPTIEPLVDTTIAQLTQVALPRAKQVGTIPTGPKLARKGNMELPSTIGLGSMAYSDKVMGPLFAQPVGKKGESSRNKWADTALVLVHRSLKAAQTYGKKDFNALYRLVLSAGIAFDKAFPQQVQPLGSNLVIQLFGSLGAGTAQRILEPAHPVIDIRPLPVAITTTGEEPPAKGGDPVDQPNENKLGDTP